MDSSASDAALSCDTTPKVFQKTPEAVATQGELRRTMRHGSSSSSTTIASETEVALKVLHFGAGNIGRGFIGKVLSEAGCEVTFADVVAPVIDRLNEKREYRVRVVGDEERVDVVKNVCGLNSLKDDVAGKVAESDLITTAVGPNIIPRLAAPIAAGIRRRFEAKFEGPLNIICCENKVGASDILRQHVLDKFDENDQIKPWVGKHVGFVNCAVDRIVPPVQPNAKGDVLEVTVETFYEWIVDATQFVGNVPKIEGMIPKDNLEAFCERKLFTLNTGHAITAYLGFLRGYSKIDEAINDAFVKSAVEKAMKQSSEVLIRRYGFDRAEQYKYIEKLLERFRNKHLQDDVTRVAREPLRKLSSKDRLVKPLLGCLEFSIPFDGLALGIAAALRYSCADDVEAVKLQAMIEEKGLKAAIGEVTGIDNPSVIADVIAAYNELK